MQFIIDAKTNKDAKAQGGARWREQVAKRERLQQAQVIKTTCRACETKPRARKQSQMQKALTALNAYIIEDLTK